jgi:GH24 family phage-related lysozyme (muramidase)
MDGHRYTALFEAPGGQPILRAYPDPISKGDPWTIGLGTTGPDIKDGTVWTADQCWAAFYNRYAVAYSAATRDVGSSCWSGLNEVRRAVLTDLSYQMGGTGLAHFTHMLAAVRAGHWEEASAEMLDSDYARQLKELQSDKTKPTRAEINAQVMITGEWPAEA